MSDNKGNTSREAIISGMEELLELSKNPENDMFYYHSSEDRIVLSHALFWVMTASVKGKMGKNKFLQILRQCQENMLAAWLTESPDFKDLLHDCNVIFNSLPGVFHGAYNLRVDKVALHLVAICIVAGGYGGDMPDDLADEILDDMDFYYNKVRCREIERLLPVLNKLVIEEKHAWVRKLNSGL